MNDSIKKELDRIEPQIESAKKNISLYEGQNIQLLKQLNELGYKTISEAEKALPFMEKELDKLDMEIEKGYNELKEKYGW